MNGSCYIASTHDVLIDPGRLIKVLFVNSIWVRKSPLSANSLGKRSIITEGGHPCHAHVSERFVNCLFWQALPGCAILSCSKVNVTYAEMTAIQRSYLLYSKITVQHKFISYSYVYGSHVGYTVTEHSLMVKDCVSKRPLLCGLGQGWRMRSY